jgi:hypothetical protein
LSPSDYRLFPAVNENRSGHRLEIDGEFKKSSDTKAQSTEEGLKESQRVQELIPQNDKYLSRSEDSVEKQWDSSTVTSEIFSMRFSRGATAQLSPRPPQC